MADVRLRPRLCPRIDLDAAEPDCVERLGGVGYFRLMGLLDRTSVVVLPSRVEAMPMFILEANARPAHVSGATVDGIAKLRADGVEPLLDPDPGPDDDLAAAP